MSAKTKCLCPRKEGLCRWENQPKRSKVGKSMGKSLAENQEESQGKVGVLVQNSQIPGKILVGGQKKGKEFDKKENILKGRTMVQIL